MDILVNGWSVFIENWLGIGVLLVTISGLGSYFADKIFKDQDFSLIKRVLIAANLGSLIMVWLIFIVVGFGQFSSAELIGGSFFIPILGGGCLILFLVKTWSVSRLLQNAPIFTVFFSLLFILLLSRLAFGSALILPPYDDSPEHYSIIRDLINIQPRNSVSFYSPDNPTGRYYHLGFHSLAAWLTLLTRTDPGQVMLWLGQVFIVSSSLSVFLLVLLITDNIPGALVAALLAGIAWRMPAFAANWGKYPAITGLAFLPGWIGLLFLIQKSSRSKEVVWLLSFLVAIGLGIIHTRLFICIFILGFSIFIAMKIPNSMGKLNGVSALIFGFLLVSLFPFVKQISIYYSTGAFLPMGMVLILVPFAVLSFPRIVLSLSLTLLGIWSASRVPVFFGGYGSKWLDAPFIELLLFIPFALLGGLGFVGLLKKMPQKAYLAGQFLIIPALLFTLFGFYSSESLLPDKCCNYATPADVSAIKWIESSSSSNAVIWISGIKAKNYMLGTDGGIWTSTLAGRNMNKLRYDFDWDPAAPPLKLCKQGYTEIYIYKGGMPFSFDSADLETVSWLEPVFWEDNVVVYRVLCPESK